MNPQGILSGSPQFLPAGPEGATSPTSVSLLLNIPTRSRRMDSCDPQGSNTSQEGMGLSPGQRVLLGCPLHAHLALRCDLSHPQKEGQVCIHSCLRARGKSLS